MKIKNKESNILHWKPVSALPVAVRPSYIALILRFVLGGFAPSRRRPIGQRTNVRMRTDYAVNPHFVVSRYVPSLEEDRETHAAIHKKYARSSQPQKVRDFSKAFGWAVIFNDGGLPEKDFDRYMDAHLAFADSLVSGVGQAEARAAIQKWERFAG